MRSGSGSGGGRASVSGSGSCSGSGSGSRRGSGSGSGSCGSSSIHSGSAVAAVAASPVWLPLRRQRRERQLVPGLLPRLPPVLRPVLLQSPACSTPLAAAPSPPGLAPLSCRFLPHFAPSVGTPARPPLPAAVAAATLLPLPPAIPSVYGGHRNALLFVLSLPPFSFAMASRLPPALGSPLGALTHHNSSMYPPSEKWDASAQAAYGVPAGRRVGGGSVSSAHASWGHPH